MQYRTKEGRTRRLVIGKVRGVDAGRGAQDAGYKLKEVTKGGDPSAERHRVRREALTIAELADLYLAEGPAAKPNKKASSWGTDRSNIERHVKPLLGRKLAAALTHDDVVKFQRTLPPERARRTSGPRKRGRAIVDGGPGTAARSLAVLGAMLQWAAHPDRKLIPANPAKGVKLLKSGKRKSGSCRRPSWPGSPTRWRRWKRASAEPDRGGGDPAVAADRLPQGGNPDAALGVG